MKIEAIVQQDGITIDADDDSVAIAQRSSSDGGEDRIWLYGRSNLDLLIAALQKAREGMTA
jgi:hypothetical protein